MKTINKNLLEMFQKNKNNDLCDNSIAGNNPTNNII